MANPVILELPPGVWVLGASAVTQGLASRLSTEARYYQTYRDAGNAAPINPPDGSPPEEAVEMFLDTAQEEIQAPAVIDAYFFVPGTPGDRAGKLRIDL